MYARIEWGSERPAQDVILHMKMPCYAPMQFFTKLRSIARGDIGDYSDLDTEMYYSSFKRVQGVSL